MNLNTPLFKTLGLSWLMFLITGLLISWLFAIPTLTVLIDRSYCPSNQWQQVSQTYTDLYHQHQRRQLQLRSVILFSNLGQEVFASPPLPEAIQALSTYGYSDLYRQAELQKTYSKTQLLGCHS
ncbi:MAG: hypothetical protein KME15_23755 [Drouetiella hepatica Uher 2000/2452]|jgi:Cu/Ag efflux pump CusA|uniref:Uncharacterized protein n=1 Tax=Drouetiella hepatica Uher 2000/2452 TaxID=904376 RepID=A0A951QF02_9CYAN|nr:hypothetical protein [Drouetiella hepatica Uher 2000/2452]